MIKKTLLLLLPLFIFLPSVFLRKENLKAPLGRHHEYITAHTLLTLDNFAINGLSYYHFSPVYTYQRLTDKKAGILGGIEDEKGDIYYVSYPPFGFLFPYFIFKTFQVPINQFTLRGLNIILHFFCSLVCLLLIYELFKRKYPSEFFLPAFVGFTLYTYLPGNLWFHGNVFFVDVVVQLFAFLSLWIFVKNLKANFENNKYLWMSVIINGLFVYTEWLSLFYLLIQGIIGLGYWLYYKKGLKFVILNAACAIFVLLGTIYQYSQIAGFNTLKDQTISKYNYRSGKVDSEIEPNLLNWSNPQSFEFLKKYYRENYLEVYYFFWASFLIILFIFLPFVLKKYKTPIINLEQFSVCVIIIGSILLHGSLLFNFTATHDFSTLKTSILFVVFISLSFGWIEILINKYLKEKFLMQISPYIFLFFTLAITHLSIKRYYLFNPISETITYHQLVAKIIEEAKATDDEVVITQYITPETIYEAKRSLKAKPDIVASTIFLKDLDFKKGLFIDFVKNYPPFEVKGVYRINSKGESLEVPLDLKRIINE